MEIDAHLGCAMSGLTADARTMIDHARVTSQNHAFTYDEKIKVESVTQAVCDLALRFGESMDNEDAMMVSLSTLLYGDCSDLYLDRVDHSEWHYSLLVSTNWAHSCEYVSA